MSTEAQKRWDAFLGKIREANDNLIAEGRAGCLQLLDMNDLEPTAMGNAWQGIRAEMFALGDKIGNTWRDKVQAAFDAAGASSQESLAQELRGRDLGDALRHEFERHEIELFAEAADRVYAAALQKATVAYRCRECGADLVIPQKFFRSLNLACNFCQRMNTFEPSTEVRMVEHFCAHHLSQRAALGEWDALQAVEQTRRKTRGDTVENLRALEAATQTYWHAYYTARAELVPDYAKDLDRDIDSRVRLVREARLNNPVWIAHERGRSA